MAESRLQLIGLHRAEFEKANQYETRKLRVDAGVALTAASGALIRVPVIAYLLSVVALAGAGLGIYWGIKGRRCRQTAERCRRALVLTNGLGWQMSAKDITDLINDCNACGADAKKWEDPNYYSSPGEPGPMALAKTVQETAFWSKNLYAKSVQYYCLWTVLAYAGAGMVLLVIPAVAKSGWLLNALQVVSVLLMFMVSSDLLGMTLAFHGAALTVTDVDERLERIIATGASMPDVIFAFTDYNSAVETVPKIPTRVYEENKGTLNERWAQRLTASSAARTSDRQA